MLISTSTPAHNQRDFPSTDAANNVSGFSPLLLSLLSPSPFPFFSPLRFSGGAPQMSTHKHSAGISASAQCRPQSWSGAAQGNPLEGQNQPEYPPPTPRLQEILPWRWWGERCSVLCKGAVGNGSSKDADSIFALVLMSPGCKADAKVPP